MFQNKENEIEFFDKFVNENEEYIGLSEKSYDRLVLELSKSIKTSEKNLKILDLGCGTGSFTKKLNSLENKIYGCDISPKSISTAKKLHPGINFSVQDIENLSFHENYFDIVIYSGVLHHFVDLKKSLKETKRILKENGFLFSFDPNINNPFFWLYRRKNSWFYSNEGVTKNEEPLSKNKIISEMELCGYRDIDVYGISNISYKYIKNKKLSLLLPIYNFADYLLNIIPFIRNSIGSFLITKSRK
ncbi:MAG TPA: class I SAM-dependent methyltransferase [Pelagibacteraceae bacterium]|jgi:ubiquinone/menaquinone biosynthesis C-methylase UbiE|nr:class I SAM-dependent methyltransferase [Pelagibacteraceae bacterium]|tara:strand:+ start:3148 stop:3882 length:735 start_codon:yes stop_codon:yes gene_type:complete